MATQSPTTPFEANEVASALRASSLPRLMSQFTLNVGILLMKERDLVATSSDDPNYPLLEELVDRLENTVADAEAVLHDAMFGEMPDGAIWFASKVLSIARHAQSEGDVDRLFRAVGQNGEAIICREHGPEAEIANRHVAEVMRLVHVIAQQRGLMPAAIKAH